MENEIVMGLRGRNIDSGEPGTVAYYGSIAETKSDKPYVGFVYDEEFGKYDGTYQGIRYFKCEPNHGVFLKAKKISFGISLIEAIRAKYINNADDLETKQVSSAADNIVDIVFVGKNKISDRKSKSEELDEMGFENENICAVYPCNLTNKQCGKCLCGSCVTELRKICASLRGLDLTNTLVTSPFVVSELFYALDRLQSVNISGCKVEWEQFYDVQTLCSSDSKDVEIGKKYFEEVMEHLCDVDPHRHIIVHNNLNKILTERGFHALIESLNPSELYIDECVKLIFGSKGVNKDYNNDNSKNSYDVTEEVNSLEKQNSSARTWRLSALSIANLREPIDINYLFENILTLYSSIKGLVLSKNKFVAEDSDSVFGEFKLLTKSSPQIKKIAEQLTFLSLQHMQISFTDFVLLPNIFPNLETLNLGSVIDKDFSAPYVYSDTELIWLAAAVFSQYKYICYKQKYGIASDRYSSSPIILTHINYRGLSKSIIKDGQRFFIYKCTGKEINAFKTFITDDYNAALLRSIMMDQILTFPQKIITDLIFKDRVTTQFLLTFAYSEPKSQRQISEEYAAAKEKCTLTDEMWEKFQSMRTSDDGMERTSIKLLQLCLLSLEDNFNYSKAQLNMLCSVLSLPDELANDEFFNKEGSETDESKASYNERYFSLYIEIDNDKDQENAKKTNSHDERIDLPKSMTILRLIDYVLKSSGISPAEFYNKNSNISLTLYVPPSTSENILEMNQFLTINDVLKGTECTVTIERVLQD